MSHDAAQNLDFFKTRALNRLKEKHEPLRTYPIEENDLVKIEHCGICKTNDVTPIAEAYIKDFNFFTTVTCNRCLYTYRSVSPSYAWFRKCWKAISTKKLEVFNPEMEEIRKTRYAKYFDFLAPYLSGKKVLDIGCGYGSGANLFKEKGCDVEVIEAEDDKAHYVKNARRIPVRGRSIEEYLKNSPSQYDLVLMVQCLEHLDDPISVLENLAKLSKPKGILYIEVPILWNSVTWSDALYLTHKVNFAKEHLTHLCERNGLEILKSVEMQQTPKDPWDIGLVLRKRETPLKEKEFSCPGSVDEVRKLYRSAFPLEAPPLNEVLKYEVPHIEQFFCTLRLNEYELLAPNANSDRLSFRSLTANHL